MVWLCVGMMIKRSPAKSPVWCTIWNHGRGKHTALPASASHYFYVVWEIKASLLF